MAIRVFALMLVASALAGDDVKIVVDTSRPYKPGDRVEVKVVPAPGVSIWWLSFWTGGHLETDNVGNPSPQPGNTMTGHFTVPQWVPNETVDLKVVVRAHGGQAPSVTIPGIQFEGVKTDSTAPQVRNVRVTELPGDLRKIKLEFDVVDTESGVFSSGQYRFDSNSSDFRSMSLDCSPTHCSATIDRFNAGLAANPTIFLNVFDKAGNEAKTSSPLRLARIPAVERPSFVDFKIASCGSGKMVFTFVPTGPRARKVRLVPTLTAGGTGGRGYVIGGARFTCDSGSCTGALNLPAEIPSKVESFALELDGENGRTSEKDLLADPSLGPLIASCLNQVPVKGGPGVREVEVRHADPVLRGGGRGGGGDDPKLGAQPR